ncbi:MAG: RDD family protein [Phycisphaerae bacterium]|nr:RDD family protein [Phycisphaerae bacterium]
MVAGVLLGVCAAGAQGARLLVAGDQQALWLLHSRDEGRFDLVTRPAGGTWQWIARDRSGTVAAMAADDAALHMAFTSRQYHVFGLLSREGAPGLSLPAAPVALCAAADLGPDAVSGLVALVPVAAATATAPARPSRGAALEVLVRTPGQWQHLTTVAGLAGDLAEVRATAWQGALYLLAPGGDGQDNRLAAWQGGEWRDLPLPAAMARGRGLALTTIDGRLAAVVAQPTTGRAGSVRLEVATMDQPGGAFALQPVTADGQEATWSQEDAPAVSRLSDKLAVVWGTGRALKLATFSPATGRLDPVEDVTIFQQPEADGHAEQIREFLLWGLLALILVPLFVLRPGGVPKPFSLPPPLEPAPLARRLAAGLVDLLPFHIAGGAYLHYTLPMSAEATTRLLIDLLRGRGAVPVQVAYAWAGMLVLFLLYGVVMETVFRATVGKLLFKLRVVGDEGADPRRLEVLLRNLFKAVEVFYFFPLLLAVVVTRYRQRLGDMAARTAVIDTRFRARPSPPAPEQDDWDDSGDASPPAQ